MLIRSGFFTGRNLSGLPSTVRRRTLSALLVGACGVGWLGTAPSGLEAQTAITVPAAHDTFVREDSPNSHYDTLDYMRVRADGAASGGQGRYSLMRFDVPAFSNVQSVKLRVLTLSAMPVTGLFHLPNATYAPNEITWANMGPHIVGFTFVQDQGPAAAMTWMEYDVTNTVTTGAKIYYFGLATSTDAAGLSFATQESTPANPAYLAVYPNTGSPQIGLSRPGTDAWYRPGYSSAGNLGGLRRGQAREATVEIRNTGSGILNVQTPSISGSSYISIQSTDLPRALAPGDLATVVLRVSTPSSLSPGRQEATLSLPTLELGTRQEDVWSQITGGRHCDPGPVTEDFQRVLDGEESATVGCWSDDYLNFQWGGSQNIPLITSAVRLFALDELNTADFFCRYVYAALGETCPGQLPVTIPRFRYLLPEELGSPNYDPISVTGVLAAQVWGRTHNHANLVNGAGRWLRAYFTLAAISATPSRVDAFIDADDPTQTVLGGYRPAYTGPSVILAGQRSCAQNWLFTTRPTLVAKALGLATNAKGAAPYDGVWDRLAIRWSSGTVAGNLYGLTSAQKTELRGLIQTTTCPSASTVNGAFTGIQAQTRLDAAGWRTSSQGPVRASTSGAVNQVNLFGAAYFPQPEITKSGKEVHVLFPWDNPPFPGTCAGTPVGGTVSLDLGAQHRMVLTPISGPAITVDLPNEPEAFRFTLDGNGASWSCTP